MRIIIKRRTKSGGLRSQGKAGATGTGLKATSISQAITTSTKSTLPLSVTKPLEFASAQPNTLVVELGGGQTGPVMRKN